jgi:cell division septum initiation protein DivIVA
VGTQPVRPDGVAAGTALATRSVSLLQTAERVAERVRAEAKIEAQQMLEAARKQAAQIRADARGDGPRLRAETEAIRGEHRRTMDSLDELRQALSRTREAHQTAAGHEPSKQPSELPPRPSTEATDG